MHGKEVKQHNLPSVSGEVNLPPVNCIDPTFGTSPAQFPGNFAGGLSALRTCLDRQLRSISAVLPAQHSTTGATRIFVVFMRVQACFGLHSAIYSLVSCVPQKERHPKLRAPLFLDRVVEPDWRFSRELEQDLASEQQIARSGSRGSQELAPGSLVLSEVIEE